MEVEEESGMATGEEPAPPTGGETSCPAGHRMTLLSANNSLTCDSCAIALGESHFLSCALCDFDLCLACSGARER